ncbi:MAG: 23S rRNA (uracil(1939)-C(5))-methyltransferase RlmD, partial [Candidatus Izemoplasmatales bacterium]
NKISNCVFLADRVEKKLPELISKKIKPDVIVFDPPRSGLDDAVINELRQAKIPRIVYVSCNPSTLAKNIAKLLDLYEIKYIQPIDMFPHTSGVESVTLLKLSNQ